MHVCFINQYFPPDVAATGQLLGQLAEDVAAVHRVTVICGAPTYDPDVFTASGTGRPKVLRVPLVPLSRRNLFVRILNYALFLIGAFVRVARLEKPDVVIAWTDPPVIGLAAVWAKWLFGCRTVHVSQDVYPEVALAAGKMNGWMSRLILKAASARILSSADRVVAIGNDMRKLLMQKGVPAHRLRMIPNWQDLDTLKPADGAAFRAKNAIEADAFVVMHSGNVGLSQDLGTLLDVASELRDNTGVLVVIVGGGAGLGALSTRADELGLRNVRFLPYQPAETLADALSAGDLHYVSLLPSFVGTVVPSKIYGILAVARPVLANLPEPCDTAAIVREAACGHIGPTDPKLLSEWIVRAFGDRNALAEMGRRGRIWVEKNGSRRHAAARYLSLLEEL